MIEKFNKIVLDNGLVILHEKRDVDVTTLMLGVGFGAVYETEEEKGISHFIEHLCFKGTEKRTTREIAAELEKVGGILNAFTSEEETAYHVKLPSEHLKLAMDVIFDIFFNPVFPEAEVEKEANVICEEIKMYEDNPGAHVLDKLKENLYEKSFGMSIAGTQESVRGLNRKKLLEKHREIYVPENSVLCVVGNNKFEDVVKLAKKFVVNREGKKPLVQEIVKRNLQKKETRKGVQQASVALGFHFPKMNEKERYSAELFTAILGQGMSSKLFTEVREKRGLAYAVKASLDVGKEYGYLVIYIGTDKEKVDEVIKICLDEFEKMSGISEEEFEEGKKQVIGRNDVDSEDSSSVCVNLFLEEISEKAEDYYDYEKNIRKVSLNDIKKLAEFSKKEHSCFSLLPE